MTEDAHELERPATAGHSQVSPEKLPELSTSKDVVAGKLTAEEQMALYEEHLKETDWGHQPC